MPSIKVICPPTLQNLHIPAFSRTFCSGAYELDGEKDASLIRFLLRYPQKGLPIDPQEIVDKGIMDAEEVAGFGYEIIVKDKKGEPVMDEETGKPKLAEPDTVKAASYEVPEGIPTDNDFAKMSIAELRDWADNPDHPVKYEAKWKKEQYVNACIRVAKKLR